VNPDDDPLLRLELEQLEQRREQRLHAHRERLERRADALRDNPAGREELERAMAAPEPEHKTTTEEELEAIGQAARFARDLDDVEPVDFLDVAIQLRHQLAQLDPDEAARRMGLLELVDADLVELVERLADEDEESA
jgi:hypothetical protein